MVIGNLQIVDIVMIIFSLTNSCKYYLKTKWTENYA